jgi:hypothetical protein
MAPSGLLYTPSQKRIISVPKYFESIDITSYSEFKNFTIGKDLHSGYWFDLGGHSFYWENNYPVEALTLYTYGGWWIFKWDYNSFKWYDSNGVERSQWYETGGVVPGWRLGWDSINYSESWTLKQIGGQEVQVSVFWGYNKTAYASAWHAFMNNDLHVLIAIGFDQENTRMNAWNLIGSLLFFQIPEVHPAINAIIAIPIWVMIAWLIYILILKAIPFVGG